ncbi:MAG: nuclear transport factor 2 family protein [Gammaproteobacteria bacterium]|nr:nuclear transport factor 2 family protein [Gammaproteobacteria bacterium]
MVINSIFNTPEQAESAFYAAFESRSVEAMMRVWSDDLEVVCIHPQGAKLVGRAAVQQSWEQILTRSPAIRIDVRNRQTLSGDSLVAHIVSEHIYVVDRRIWQGPILATNVYRRGGMGWQIVLHHASAAPSYDPIPSGVTRH